jgi:hypothetical protein
MPARIPHPSDDRRLWRALRCWLVRHDWGFVILWLGLLAAGLAMLASVMALAGGIAGQGVQ